MSENEKLVERARAYVPFNQFKDGPLVAELAAALTAAEGRIKALEAERDGALAVLAGLSSFFGAGLGDDTTTAEQFDRRIREGVDVTYAPMVEAWRKETAR